MSLYISTGIRFVYIGLIIVLVCIPLLAFGDRLGLAVIGLIRRLLMLRFKFSTFSLPLELLEKKPLFFISFDGEF